MTDPAFQTVVFSYEHIKAAARLESICFADPWSEESLRYLCSTPVTYGVAVMNGDILCAYGGMEYVLDEAHIMNIATDPAFRRMGCAGRVLDALESFATGHGVTKIMLDVRDSNAPARALYEKAGYFETGRLKNYYRHPVEDAIEMAKNL